MLFGLPSILVLSVPNEHYPMVYCCVVYDVHGMVWQDEHQQARCWFGAGISQQMQGEHDAALQSLDIAENLSSEESVPDKAWSDRQRSSSSDSSTSDEDTPFVSRIAKPGSKSAEKNSAQGHAVKTLLGKTLLAKASILKQLERTHEANECMKCAKALDPAIGKYIKD